MAPRIDAKWWHVGSDDNIIFVRNPESSNSTITNYGDLFKMLLGGANSFLLMYLEPSEGFKIFNNQYNEIFHSIYGSSKDAVELFIMAITKIKENGLEEDHLKLNYALVKCLEKKIDSFSQNPNVKTSTMLQTINLFEIYTLSNIDEEKKRNLEHMKVLEKLKKQVNDRQLGNLQEKTELPNKPSLIPTFDDMHQLAVRYDLTVDENNQSHVRVTDRVNGNPITDKDEIANAIFANIWLQSAGIKKKPMEDKAGEDYAFSEQSRNLYNFFVRSVEHSLRTIGNIDSVSIFKSAELLNYKYSQEVISNLFRSDYQANFIDDFFRRRYLLDKEKDENPQTLYNILYANDIAYNNDEVGKSK